MRQDVRIPDEKAAGGAVTWAAVALRALEAACESWVKLARVCVVMQRRERARARLVPVRRVLGRWGRRLSCGRGLAVTGRRAGDGIGHADVPSWGVSVVPWHRARA